MSKYVYFFALKWQQSTNYRLRLVTWIFVDLATPILMVILFRGLYQGRAEIRGYTYPSLVTYYVLIALLRVVTESHINERLEKLIHEGGLTNYLLQPISVWWSSLINSFAWKTFKLMLFAPIIGSLFLVYRDHIDLNLAPGRIGYFILATSLSILLTFSIRYCLGLLAFFLTTIWGVSHVESVLVSLLSGSLIPLSFLPETLQNINNFLPFKYLLAFPISILRGTSDETILYGIGVQLVYLIALGLLQQKLYSLGLRRYEAVGR